jgi:hypothetical protein
METSDNSSDFNLPESNKRPQALKILCILTFVSAGLSMLSSIFNLLGGPLSPEVMEEQKVEMIKMIDELKSLEMHSFVTMLEQVQRMTESINAQFYMVSLVSIIVIGTGLFGALSMWKGKKIGFHLYIIYSLFSVIQLYFFVSPADIPTIVVVWNLILAAVFVILYSRHLKWLK